MRTPRHTSAGSASSKAQLLPAAEELLELPTLGTAACCPSPGRTQLPLQGGQTSCSWGRCYLLCALTGCSSQTTYYAVLQGALSSRLDHKHPRLCLQFVHPIIRGLPVADSPVKIC